MLVHAVHQQNLVDMADQESLFQDNCKGLIMIGDQACQYATHKVDLGGERSAKTTFPIILCGR